MKVADQRFIVRTLLKVAVLVAATGILCGFDNAALQYDLRALRGQPIGAVIARLGPPIQKGFINGSRLYYWRVAYYGSRDVCKIWGIIDKQGVVTTSGYQDCSF
jgi:hypothetical protein